jgi:hypothetical protein
MWMPFLAAIAKRSGDDIADLIQRVMAGEVQLAFVWDEEAQRARALLGIRFVKCGSGIIGEVIWLTGNGRRHWQHLIVDLERYFVDCGCSASRLICRPGWSRVVDKGYRITHYMMEKQLCPQAAQDPHP